MTPVSISRLAAVCIAAAFWCGAASAWGTPPFPLTSIRSIDGSDAPAGGQAGAELLRVAAPDYPDDGSGDVIKQPPLVPNPRDVSNTVVAQPSSIVNDRNLSDMVWAWGQFLDHDLDLTLTHPIFGTADIPILDVDDPLGPFSIPFDRSDFHPDTGLPGVPRQQINAITSLIDASNVYGSDPIRADALRTFSRGRLKTSEGNLLPFNTDGLPNAGGLSDLLFVAGDIRANEQVGLTAMHTLFVREHNRLAETIAKVLPKASDEEIYQLARKIVGAEMQIITYREFLPALLGPWAPSLDDYDGWDPSVDPGIANEFSTASFRFGHSMLSPSLMLADKKGAVGALPLRDAFFNPEFLAGNPNNVDLLLAGFTRQRAQEIDSMIVDDVRNFLFGPPGAGGLDLASLNIQRGRDHGLPGYNELREAYGLDPMASFADVSSDPVTVMALASVYDSVDDIDPWVGGLAEDHLPGASVGELVAAVLVDQFTRLRDGDPYFFLGDPDLAQAQMHMIIQLHKVTLSDVIRWNTSAKTIGNNAFFVAP
jgi:hypothetical protein